MGIHTYGLYMFVFIAQLVEHCNTNGKAIWIFLLLYGALKIFFVITTVHSVGYIFSSVDFTLTKG